MAENTGNAMGQQNIWLKLLQATDVIRELHHRESRMERAPLEATIAEAKIMHYVVFHPEGCSVKEIAEWLGTTRGAVSQIIGKMVDKGPLIRVPDEKTAVLCGSLFLRSAWSYMNGFVHHLIN